MNLIYSIHQYQVLAHVQMSLEEWLSPGNYWQYISHACSCPSPSTRRHPPRTVQRHLHVHLTNLEDLPKASSATSAPRSKLCFTGRRRRMGFMGEDNGFRSAGRSRPLHRLLHQTPSLLSDWSECTTSACQGVSNLATFLLGLVACCLGGFYVLPEVSPVGLGGCSRDHSSIVAKLQNSAGA